MAPIIVPRKRSKDTRPRYQRVTQVLTKSVLERRDNQTTDLRARIANPLPVRSFVRLPTSK